MIEAAVLSTNSLFLSALLDRVSLLERHVVNVKKAIESQLTL